MSTNFAQVLSNPLWIAKEPSNKALAGSRPVILKEGFVNNGYSDKIKY